MTHIVGEVVTIRTREGGGYDRYGDELPEKIVDTAVAGCVVFVVSTEAFSGNGTYDGEETTVCVLFPSEQPVEQGTTLVIRGDEWRVFKPPFAHRSAFGSRLGGTEAFARRALA